MRFLSVAERELRAGARQKVTHRLRWITASAFLALLAWLMWVFDGFRAPQIFHAFSAITLFYCLIIGTARTADCLSSEKREGTLGLLFLTNLNGPEIIGGKLCSSAVAAAYGLFAIFPLLALQMLIGGITLGHFWRTILALADAIVFAVATGFLASSICLRQFTGIAWATGAALFFTAGLMAEAALLSALGGGTAARSWVEALVVFSPLYTLISADGTRGMFGPNHYWWSVLIVAGMSALFLGVATWRVSSSWQDRPTGGPLFNKLALLERWRERGREGRKALRRRLLNINPFYWLGDRRRVSAPSFMVLMLVIVPITSLIAAPYFGRVLRAGVFSPVLGHLFAWLWAGIGIQGLVLYYAAMTSSRRLAEDKQSGALELVLSTPTTERSISRGLWLAYGRRMFFPASAAILVHLFFIWQGLNMFLLDAPGTRIPRGTSVASLAWHAFFNVPFGTNRIEWQFVMAMRIVLLLLVLAICVWVTLGWLGRWLGLRMKHPGFAPMISLGLIIIPPVILFSIVCYCADKVHLMNLPERVIIPILMWTAAGIGAAHCALISAWAANRLRTQFRNVVTSRFQPKPLRPWWRPNLRIVVRFGVGSLAAAAAVVIIILCFYGYQNWRSRRAWAAFQRELKQRGQSLDIAALLPRPVPADQNFALTPAFLNSTSHATTNAAIKRLLGNLKDIDTLRSGAQTATMATGTEWTVQTLSSLDGYLSWVAPGVTLRNKATREEFAAALLANLRPHEETLQAIAAASRLPCFQAGDSCTATGILDSARSEYSTLERLHMLFQMRASAWLATNQVSEAKADLMTSLQLARLSQQIPDPQSPMRTQVLLTRSLQPLWEGIIEHQWTEPQLAQFQGELSKFNLLANYTNAIHRVVLAHIESWRAIAASKTGALPVPPAQTPWDHSAWQMQPRAWWLDYAVQLHKAADNAIGNVDVPGANVRTTASWGDLDGLPIESPTASLFSQAYWPGPYPANVVFAQTAVNQTIIACALERFRIEEVKYPGTLEVLIPRFLPSIPADIVRGRPILYEKVADDRFILRGVGPNGIDDRKKPSSDDWLWSFPTNLPPAITK